MKNLFFWGMLLLACSTIKAQLVSYHIQESFTKTRLDSFLDATGFSLPLAPNYDIDIYQVIYRTPYKHIDSLVNASGIVVVPKSVACPMPLGCYAHGTFTKRVQVPSYEGPERPISFFFSGIGGILTVMPDELGLGDSDSNIIVHPYINAFHSGHASVNLMRAARQLADTLGLQLSGEVLLTGYSQGGYTTMATHKLIQESYASEFNIIASAPMSGAYDLKETMVDVMLSYDPYPTPSYLPYLLLGYHSVYPSMQQLFPNPADIFKSPYDSILPPMFYSKQYSTNDINNFCTSVPRLMIKDSLLNDFANDSLHPLRLILAENDLLGWAPQAPVKIYYCTGDLQVSYLNAERAYVAWQANGATALDKQDIGAHDHGPCVEPSLTSALLYLFFKVSPCVSGIWETEIPLFRIFPNPAKEQLHLIKEEGAYTLTIYDITGREIITQVLTGTTETIAIHQLAPGFYAAQLTDGQGAKSTRKFIVQQ